MDFYGKPVPRARDLFTFASATPLAPTATPWLLRQPGCPALGGQKWHAFKGFSEEGCTMPIFEYHCLRCGVQFQKLILKKEEEDEALCPKCTGRQLKKLISRVAYHVSESDRLESYDLSARQADSFYNDSRNIGLHAKKRAKQMGVDLGGQFEEKLEKLRTDPGSVIRDSD
jgi:putative FmdB family regulatory protein